MSVDKHKHLLKVSNSSTNLQIVKGGRVLSAMWDTMGSRQMQTSAADLTCASIRAACVAVAAAFSLKPPRGPRPVDALQTATPAPAADLTPSTTSWTTLTMHA